MLNLFIGVLTMNMSESNNELKHYLDVTRRVKQLAAKESLDQRTLSLYHQVCGSWSVPWPRPGHRNPTP